MRIIAIILMLIFPLTGFSSSLMIQPGAYQLSSYLPMLKNKRVAVFANHTSLIGQEHLVDVLLTNHIKVVKIFSPEHGFRGSADDGDHILDAVDAKTQIPIISLYGNKQKPTTKDLQDADVIVFDIQDVGVRFYTYISSLQKIMEAALETNKELIILDRPNPNGFYVDGPILQSRYKSFTGMQPIPIVYGMTIGEYAKMLVGENWLSVKPAAQIKLTVIPCVNYTHKSLYEPPIRPSPNLPDIQSIYLYPTIGLLEGTMLSIGRGTDFPFQVFGHPEIKTSFTFTPNPKLGAKSPLYNQQICYGVNLKNSKQSILKELDGKIKIKYLKQAYQLFPNKEKFFKKSFNYGVGNNLLIDQIKANVDDETIRASWQAELQKFKTIRKKYLLYEDFE